MKKSLQFLILFIFINSLCLCQWQSDLRITNNTNDSYTSFNNAWCIATSGDTVHIVWFDAPDGNYEIYYKRSTDRGVTWGMNIRLTNNTAFSARPSISVYGAFVYVVWQDKPDGNYGQYEIYYNRSTDGGTSWGTATRLTYNTEASEVPSIAVSEQCVHVVWIDSRDGNSEIYYKRTTDGINWEADKRLTSNLFESAFPSVSVSGQVVHAVWHDNRDGNREIYYKRSTDGGISWESDLRITNNLTESRHPTIAVSNSAVHIAFQDRISNNAVICYKHSIDGGSNWDTNTQVINNSTYTQYPSIAISGQAVHVVWLDNRNFGDNEIYYNRSTDGGISWGTDVRLTNAAGNSQLSSIAVSNSVVHVVWQDSRDGNDEVYYKRNPTGNPPPCNSLVVNASPDTTIYYGYGVQQAILTAIPTGGTGPYSYIWSDNSTSQSIIVNPAITTSYSVTITDVNNCHAIDEVTVNVIDIRCGNNNQKVLVCHNGNAICINANAVPAHLNHGDVLGNCGDNIVTEETKPNENNLFQNYPNPFNPITNIKFYIKNSYNVQLIIYDISGKEIETIVNNRLNSGTYSIDWNGEKYASGIYIYKLITDDFVVTKKFVLLK